MSKKKKFRKIITNILALLYFLIMTFIMINSLYWIGWFIIYIIKLPIEEFKPLPNLAILTILILFLISFIKSKEEVKRILSIPFNKLIEIEENG